MPNRAMARRMAALQMCIDLHRGNEIDDNLLPIGKENFKAKPEDAEVPALPDESRADFSEARPGTTKRRQYYYKKVSCHFFENLLRFPTAEWVVIQNLHYSIKTAEALTDCRPIVGVPSYLYHINMVLSCPLPEEQNTRGRRIYPPEESAIGFGILTLKEIPKVIISHIICIFEFPTCLPYLFEKFIISLTCMFYVAHFLLTVVSVPYLY